MTRTIVITKKDLLSVSELMLFVEKQKYNILRSICDEQGLDIRDEASLFFSPSVLKTITASSKPGTV